jgi:hypothetical protein
MFLRQISAPVSGSAINLDEDSDEPEWEPGLDDEEDDVNVDQFQSIPAPSRQVSVISNHSGKGPSRQLTAMSNLSGFDWEPVGASGMKRQQTDEKWPTWNGKDPRVDSHEETAIPCVTSPMGPNPTTAAMLQTWGTMSAFQSAGQPKLEDCFDNFPFRRKRDSLIDLAKQEQEEKDGHSKSLEINFCCWCGNKCRPSFKFCVFCGNAIR